jgi:GT2 family glycosyltransferase
MKTIFGQTRMPFQIIIVDGSQNRSARQVALSFHAKFEPRGCQLIYVQGGSNGLPAARNLGVEFAKGDAIFFLDDDTLVDRDVIHELSNFLRSNETALGVEPLMIISGKLLSDKLDNGNAWKILAKILMLGYREKNRLGVRRSGETILPSSLTRPIIAQRLLGFAMCYRVSVFKKHSFDTNLKRWGYLEDLDFSYRVQRSNPNSLYAIPQAKVLHKITPASRIDADLRAQMMAVYRFYIFFKNQSHESILNIPAFLLAQFGRLIEAIIRLAMTRSHQDSWQLIYFLRSYVLAFRNLRDILKADLEFFNNKVNAA